MNKSSSPNHVFVHSVIVGRRCQITRVTYSSRADDVQNFFREFEGRQILHNWDNPRRQEGIWRRHVRTSASCHGLLHSELVIRNWIWCSFIKVRRGNTFRSRSTLSRLSEVHDCVSTEILRNSRPYWINVIASHNNVRLHNSYSSCVWLDPSNYNDKLREGGGGK